ncbi:restriction endonuclease [Klebsiella quasipneumoniae]|uniref:restriction endonuclease n=1 Tax=Klebsiella quasipneumoniae TaxID=1463165 RepID=UPI0002C405B7|nr:restriction endonuclease [Klebsiella quasipneumoniae]AVF87542.1 restriction endonuclease [Klebsiella quasipneumoniae]AWO60934.1 restriction endonuclease [Klebsiella quasipneumoniae subsp. similipneumoniae]EMR16774.1 restriction endonuclease [Klebsiella quasipneumoniae]MBK5766212.1 restriction endonuclease [Klebsiella quasipneumoniae]MBK5776857.1 restriction endonuclease [Klebsiella quasipneumoniae]
MSYKNWHAYQEATAKVFRDLGCNAQIDFRTKGARATHDIDVYATFFRSGILCTWVIECKLWKTRVPKEKVLILKSIIEDLGADRGIIVSEVGFQSGAYDAARWTNITLVTSLDEFSRTALAAASEVPLILNSSGEGEPIYQFPNLAGPHDLLLYNNVIISANWIGCSIAIINPASKAIIRTIDLDKYEKVSPQTGAREILSHPPGSLVIADGRLFVGQVFSEVILVIDLATHAIVKRIAILGGGEGQLVVSHDEKKVYFASNTINQFYIIDSATYDVTTVPYPEGGRGCMSLLRHPTQPLLYIGVSRGGRINGQRYPHANSYLAIYDLSRQIYLVDTQLAEVRNGRADDATPACLTYDDIHNRIYIGMFRSQRGICVLDAESGRPVQDIRFEANSWSKPFSWVDPLSQALTVSSLLSVNRNNNELVVLDRSLLHLQKSIFLGNASNGPRAVLVWQNQAIVSYPGRNGLIFISLNSSS